MRFKEGSRVEVLRNKKEAYGSWFPARTLSKVGNMYTVRYELCLTSKGEPMIEKVPEEDIRPCPLLVNEGESWAVGDIAEAFDLCCWRVGKIAKIFRDNCCVVRLFGSIQLKKFHVSDLRVRQAWRNNRWISLGKAFENKEIYNSSKYETYIDSGENGFKYEEACTRQKHKQDYVCSFQAERTNNRNINFHGSSLLDDTALRGNNSKRMCTFEVGEYYPPIKRAQPRKVDALPFSNNLVGKTFMQPIIEESIECSVASCSGNNLPEYSPLDDTTSSPASKKSYRDVFENGLVANVHELELHAYKSTVQALYASGPLSWEQESLLTNLRMSLHISNEEHLLQLRNLLSD
ncbi:uncharacterized protein LOC109833028 isoform X1 [Asparagus officinalis]|nr:uncharacterized protein LOC109833028 isoform X1 [Asparagus officinalis]XP_020256150.1 uncharacterized protein LOC109833028 isoform X1 [Asparagus officinalis]XP_020256151.1 uncharacterized protein LOC109833028 isoform X1 [Asparagus officinalis]XP_020256152.1 uncharacterized protein LOC109833028 isoform X1 [Asparagus officinalis]XP_020256153.1 uncharacterized protein LOC109833028 isoform X1 [Asparagus officinalis]